MVATSLEFLSQVVSVTEQGLAAMAEFDSLSRNRLSMHGYVLMAATDYSLSSTDITVFMDVERNPGPISSEEGYDLRKQTRSNTSKILDSMLWQKLFTWFEKECW